VTRRSALAALACCPLLSQSPPRTTDYRSDLPHPRLLLPPRRARLLERERERQTLRWVAFDTLVLGKAVFPEQGFAMSLYYVASKSQDHARQAIEWALGPGNDLRQLALVYDWCFPVLTTTQRTRLATKMQGLLAKTTGSDIASARTRAFAAIALSDEHPDLATQTVKTLVEDWWRSVVLTPLESGKVPFELGSHHGLFEMFHALRDNFDIDLREPAAKFFTTLPIYHLLLHYPAPFPAPENEYRIPLMKEHGEPDLREAVRSRAAALSMVAYDNNAQEMQFLQGWLIQDRFLMRGTWGIPYEFLWANPYQPGLSFHYLPNVLHDPKTGRLVIRSKWEDDAVWFHLAGGKSQMFLNGQISNVTPQSFTAPIEMGNTVLMPASAASKFRIAPEDHAMRYYIVGLKPDTKFDLEVDDEELREVESDHGGVLELNFPPKRTAGILLREAGAILKS